MVYLIAKKTGHSFSPLIHKEFGRYDYGTRELEESELREFFEKREFSGLNVTTPYKTTVMKYLDEISPEAQKIGAVNTIVNRDGKLFGYNTDKMGFSYTLEQSNIVLEGKDILVIGSGGASKAVVAALEEFSPKTIRILRHCDNVPERIAEYLDAQIIVNTTPVGMFPNNYAAPIELEKFTKAEAVFDVIFNPLKTRLLLDAHHNGIPYFNGLRMLVAQAKAGCELFSGMPVDDGEIERIHDLISEKTQNVTLVGMPGCGKTSIGRYIAEKLGKSFVDTDEEICALGRTPAEMIMNDGEDSFRKIENEIVKKCGQKSGFVIATGGGVVTRLENYDPLFQNGIIIFIDRDVSLLATKGRPLSSGGVDTLKKLYSERLPLYERFSHFKIDGNYDIKVVGDRIIALLEELKR